MSQEDHLWYQLRGLCIPCSEGSKPGVSTARAASECLIEQYSHSHYTQRAESEPPFCHIYNHSQLFLGAIPDRTAMELQNEKETDSDRVKSDKGLRDKTR